MRRFTEKEWRAIEHALNASLAGPLDGIEDDHEEAVMRAAMESALSKTWERL